MTVPERFLRYGSSRLCGRVLNRTAGATLAVLLISCQVAALEGAATPAAKAEPSPQHIDAHHIPYPSSQSDSRNSCAGSQQYMESGAVFAMFPADVTAPLTLSGWFHIIRNGVPRYMLVDDAGKWVQLLIDDQVLRDVGGPLGLNRKRVRVTGHRSEKTPEAIRVIAINLEE